VHVACRGEVRNTHEIMVGIPESDCLENLGVDGRITLELIVEKWDRKVWNAFSFLRIGSIGGLL